MRVVEWLLVRWLDRLLVAFLNWRKRARKAKHLRWVRKNHVVFFPEPRLPDYRDTSDAYMKSIRSKR